MPACNLPEAVFVDDVPLVQVLTKNEPDLQRTRLFIRIP